MKNLANKLDYFDEDEIEEVLKSELNGFMKKHKIDEIDFGDHSLKRDKSKMNKKQKNKRK